MSVRCVKNPYCAMKSGAKVTRLAHHTDPDPMITQHITTDNLHRTSQDTVSTEREIWERSHLKRKRILYCTSVWRSYSSSGFSAVKTAVGSAMSIVSTFSSTVLANRHPMNIVFPVLISSKQQLLAVRLTNSD